MLKSKEKYWNILLFLFIFGLSALFRLIHLELIEFKIDEASNLLLASQLLFGHPLPPGGIATSVGVLNPPLFNYLLSPFTLISLNPIFITFIVAFINCLAIGFIFLIVKKYYNQTLAFIVSLLMSFSPWAIIFSRKIWPPDIVIPFMVVVIYSIHKIILEKKTIFWIPLTSFLLLIIQLDLAYVFFVFSLFLFLLLAKLKINIKYMIVGAIIASIPLLPYGVYQLRNNCPDCSLILSINKKLSHERSLSNFLRPLQITSQGNFRFLIGEDVGIMANNYSLFYKLRTVLYAEYVLTIIGIFIYWKRYPKFRFLIYSILFTLILYFIFRLRPEMHYFILFIPFLFIFIGTSIHTFWISKRRIIKYFSLIMFLLIISASLLFNLVFFDILKKNKGFKGDYGQSLTISYPSMEKQFEKYRGNKNYKEIILSGYIPLNVMYGSSSFAQMLYPSKDTEKKLSSIEDTLKNFPDDPRIIHRLLVFYTKNPTRSTVDNLRSKLKDIPPYHVIFNQVRSLYLQKNYKNLFQDLAVPFIFEYPSHWKLKEDQKDNIIETSNEKYIFSIQRFSQSKTLDSATKTIKVFDKKIKKTNCFTKEKYCGTKFETFEIEGFYYQIAYRTKNGPVEFIESEIEVMDDIVNSFRLNEKYYKGI